MAGILKVDQYQDFNGNNIMTSDGSGNLTLNNAAMKATPAFEAYASAYQSGVSDAVWTKININTEVYDTDSCYDATTNYRFTPTVAGKYFVYVIAGCVSDTTYKLNVANVAIYKNGSAYRFTNITVNGADRLNEATTIASATIDMNGSSDYLEPYARVNVTTGTGSIDARQSNGGFGAYRIIGA